MSRACTSYSEIHSWGNLSSMAMCKSDQVPCYIAAWLAICSEHNRHLFNTANGACIYNTAASITALMLPIPFCCTGWSLVSVCKAASITLTDHSTHSSPFFDKSMQQGQAGCPTLICYCENQTRLWLLCLASCTKASIQMAMFGQHLYIGMLPSCGCQLGSRKHRHVTTDNLDIKIQTRNQYNSALLVS